MEDGVEVIMDEVEVIIEVMLVKYKDIVMIVDIKIEDRIGKVII